MKTQKEPQAFTYGALAIGIALPLAPVLLYAVMMIQYHLNPQPGAEFGFMLLYPIVLFASFALLLEGIFLIISAIFKKGIGKRKRTIIGILGLLILTPAIYSGYGMWASWFIKANANRVISNQAALNLVQECKVQGVNRDNEYNSSNQLKPTAKLYLKESAQSQIEKGSRFYTYRSFDASYYDELFKISQSDTVKKRCGYINYSDVSRESIPDTVKWVTVDEAKNNIDTCSINEIFPSENFEENEFSKLSNPNDSSTGIFMSVRPSRHGGFGRLYLGTASDETKKTLLDFANTKKPVCVYHLPNIIN